MNTTSIFKGMFFRHLPTALLTLALLAAVPDSETLPHQAAESQEDDFMIVELEQPGIDFLRLLFENKRDTSILKQEVSTLQQDVATLQQDVATLQRDVAMLQWKYRDVSYWVCILLYW
jgi:hypothetical protein